MKKISVIAVFGLLCSLFSGCGFTVHFGKEGFDENYSVGSFEYNSGEIRNVKIEWVSGSVKIVESDSDRLKVTETDKEWTCYPVIRLDMSCGGAEIGRAHV